MLASPLNLVCILPSPSSSNLTSVLLGHLGLKGSLKDLSILVTKRIKNLAKSVVFITILLNIAKSDMPHIMPTNNMDLRRLIHSRYPCPHLQRPIIPPSMLMLPLGILMLGT